MTQQDGQCCFCGERVAPTAEEPIEISVYFKNGSSQGLWAHIDCAGNCLHTTVPWLSKKDYEDAAE